MSEARSECRIRNAGAGIRRLLVLALAVSGASVLSAEKAEDPAAGWHVAQIEKQTRISIPIPVLAEIKGNDDSGETWQQNGTVPGSLAVACRDFRMSIQSVGWVLDKTIAVGRPVKRSELMILTQRRHRVLLMIWEIEPGLCGFSWGEER